MEPVGTQLPSSPGAGPHLLLYDGGCGLCHGVVQFLLARDPVGRFHFAALQSPVAAERLAPFGGRPAELSTFYLLTDYGKAASRCLVKSDAALFLAREVGWPWRVATLFGGLPVKWRNGVYDWVARNRHRVLGRRETCLVPRPEYRDRFVDLGAERAAPAVEDYR